MQNRRMTEDWKHRMREDWDKRARENPLQYTVGPTSDSSVRDLGIFFEEGKTEAAATIRPVLDKFHFSPAGRRILDIGCGVGRMFPGFAEVGFSEIWGVDVSAEMVDQGRRLCPVPQAHFVVGDGESLSGLPSDYFDYCFSQYVFENLPDLRMFWRYLDDMHRVLRSGGVFQLNFRGQHILKARMALLVPVRLRPAAKTLYRFVTLGWLHGRSTESVDIPGRWETMWGMPAPPREVARRLAKIGFADVEIYDALFEGDRKGVRFWATGRKP